MHFANQCGVLVLIRLLQVRGESGHPHLLVILPDLKHCVSLSLSIFFQHTFTMLSRIICLCLQEIVAHNWFILRSLAPCTIYIAYVSSLAESGQGSSSPYITFTTQGNDQDVPLCSSIIHLSPHWTD